MMDTIVEKDYLKDSIIAKLNIGGNAHANLSSIKKEAVKLLESQELPALKAEEWKYTPITKALQNFNWKVNPQTAKINADDFKFDKVEAYYLFFVNGKYASSISDLNFENGLKITSNSDLSADATKNIGSTFTAQPDIFTNLNTAYFQDIVSIQIEKSKVIEKPIIVQHIMCGAETVISQPRILIHIGENSQVTIVENFQSVKSEEAFTNAVTEISLEKNAIAKYYKIQNEDSNAIHIGTTQVNQVDKSTFTATTISLNGKIIRNNLNLNINGEYCEGNMNGLYFVDGNTLVDNHTLADHLKPNSRSNELYKGIMQGKSKGVFNGKIYVRPDAQKTNAFQSNKNILLSPDASVNTKPQLEIWADDVKCSHGTTTGQLDDESIFYLRSRGIGAEKAKAMLMFAFAEDILENVSIEPLKIHLKEIIAKRLNYDI